MFYYVGIAKKRMGNQNLFSGSVTLDEGGVTDQIDFDDPKCTQQVSDFYERGMNKIQEKDSDAKYIFYNPYGYYFLKHRKNFNCLCINKKKLIFDLFDKFKQQKMFKNEALFLDYKFSKGKNVSFSKCKQLFSCDEDVEFVIQQNSGYAGFGTFYLNKQNEKKILPLLEKEQRYRISIYQRNNTPINSTILIAGDCVKILKPSIQNISVGKELNYDGANFDIKHTFTKQMFEAVENLSLRVAEKLKKLGYRGILGIDSIFVDGKLFFMECNARFQASSTYINDCLVEKGFPSLYELNMMCFDKKSNLSKFDLSNVY